MRLAPIFRQKFFDSNGNPLAGGFVYSYLAQTTTPEPTYSNADGTENLNPTELDANGEADIWLDPAISYKLTLTDSNNIPIMTIDKVSSIVGEDEIEDGAITQAKLAVDSVAEDKIVDASITEDKIGDQAVTTAKLGALSVTAAKIAADAVTTAKILDANVTTAKIADLAVTKGKLAALGELLSSACTTFSASGSYADVTNLTGSFTVVRGSLVVVAIVPSGTAFSQYGVANSTGALAGLYVKALRDATSLGEINACEFAGSTAGSWSKNVGGLLLWADLGVTPGTYTYKIQAKQNGTAGGLANVKMLVFEL